MVREWFPAPSPTAPMSSHPCAAIVLRRTRYSESSLIVVAFTREHGRIDALAKGCRRERSPMRGHLDLFSREELLVFERERSGLDLVVESSVSEEYMALRTRPAAFAAACLAGELLCARCMV